MQFLLDNLLASIVASMVFLILASATLQNQLTSVETTNLYSLKSQELDFIEVLKRDLHGVKKVSQVKENPIDKSFTFRAKLNNANDTVTVPVKYVRNQVGERDGVALYQIQRYESGVPAGASMVTLTSWKIEARNAEGGMIADPADAAQVYVRFEAAAPWKDDPAIRRTRWEATFRPPLLRNDVLL